MIGIRRLEFFQFTPDFGQAAFIVSAAGIFQDGTMEVVDRVEIKDAIRGDVTGSGRAGG